jgi:hypothetical protein
MNLQELLENHPKTATVVKQWLLERMLRELRDDKLPEDFKELVRQQGITDDKVVGILENSPRDMFDLFDSHKVFITIVPFKEQSYGVKINDVDYEGRFSERIHADGHAIFESFKILEAKL